MSCRTVLVIRPAALGDTILTLPVLDSIRKEHPGAAITFLGNRAYRDLLPSWTRFHAFDDPAWLWLFNTEQTAPPRSAQRYDRAYVILTRPEEVIRNLQRSGTVSVRHCSSSPQAGLHLVQHFHEALGLILPQRRPNLTRVADGPRKDVIWVHPGSGGPRKCLPLRKFMPIVTELSKTTGWKLAITMGEEDAFVREQPGWNQIIQSGVSILENRSLPELCSQLGNSRLFLGNDSGISHLAANLGIPSAVFFVATDPVKWAPWVPPDQMCVIDLRRQDLEELDFHTQLANIRNLLS